MRVSYVHRRPQDFALRTVLQGKGLRLIEINKPLLKFLVYKRKKKKEREKTTIHCNLYMFCLINAHWNLGHIMHVNESGL